MGESALTVKKNYYAWVILGCSSLIQFLIIGIGANTLSMYMLPVVTEYPDISRTRFALIFTIMNGVISIASFVFGDILKKLGVRKVITLGSLLMVISLFVYSCASSSVILYVAALCGGLSLGLCGMTICFLLVKTWFAKNHGMLIAICLAFNSIGGTIFNPIVGRWIESYTWQGSLRISCMIVAAAAIALIFLVRESPEKMGLKPFWYEDKGEAGGEATIQQEVKGFTRPEAMRTINFWCICIMFLFIGTLCYSLNGTMAAYAGGLGFDTVTVGTVISVLYVTIAVVKIPAGWLVDRIGVRYLMVGCFCSLIACYSLMMQPSLSLPLLYLAAALVGISGILLSIPLPLVVGEVFGNKDYASILGTISGVMYIGLAAGNPILNFGYDLTGSYSGVFMFFIPAVIICIFLCFLGTRKFKTQSAENS